LRKMNFVPLVVCIVVLSAWHRDIIVANDDLQLMWKVPRESQFLGFCFDNGNDDFALFVIAPEMPITIYSRQIVDEKILSSPPPRKKSRLLKGFNGLEIIHLSPEGDFQRPPFAVDSLLLPSESASGEVSAILGYPFTREFILKYDSSQGKAQIRRSSIEIRRPIRSYSGRQAPGQGLVLDGMKLQGKNAECLLSFCADVDLVLGSAVQQELSPSDFGHVVNLDLLTNSNPIVPAPVAKQFAFINRLELDLIKINKVCCLLDDQCPGMQIGWGLLQDFDFEIEFHGTEFEFRIYDISTTRNKKFRKGELNCIMTDDGLQVVEIASWSTLFQYLQKDDLVVRAGDQVYPGAIYRNAEIGLLSQRFNGGFIEIIRNTSRIIVDVPKDENAFDMRDRFLFNHELK